MKNRCASALFLCLLVAGVAAAAPSSPPETPEGRRMRALLAAFETGTPDALRAFVSANFAASALAEVPLEERVARLGSMAKQAGPLEFDRVLRESGSEIGKDLHAGRHRAARRAGQARVQRHGAQAPPGLALSLRGRGSHHDP